MRVIGQKSILLFLFGLLIIVKIKKQKDSKYKLINYNRDYKNIFEKPKNNHTNIYTN